jgi:hypothetical protein
MKWREYWDTLMSSHDEVSGVLYVARETLFGAGVFVFMLWITNTLEPSVRWALSWL